MKPKWATTLTELILIGLYLAFTLVYLSGFSFIEAFAQKAANNYLYAPTWSNDTSDLKSQHILNPTKYANQVSQNLTDGSTINLSTNPGHSQNPEILTRGPNLYALWMDDTPGNRDLFFRRSTDNGRTFEKTINLSNNLGGSFNPSMVVSSNTSYLYAVWEHIPGANGEIFFTRSADNGKSFEKPIIIGNNSGLNGFPQVALSENGTNVYVVWNDIQSGVMLRRSTDGGSTFETAISLSNKNKDSQNPQITVSDNNNVYVTWQSNPHSGNGEIVFTRSTNRGESFENPIKLVKVDKINQNESEEQNIVSFQPRIVTSSGGKDVYVIWHSGFSVSHLHYYLLTDILFSRSTDNGATFEDPISLTNHSVWVKNSDNGAPFVSPVTLNGYSGWPLNPQMAIAPDNNLYVAWQSTPHAGNGEIVFTRSTDKGASFEKAVTISNKNGSSQNPQMAIAPDNSVYFIWDNNATGNEEIVLQKANPANVQLNSSSSSQQDTGLQNITASKNMSTISPKRIALVQRTFTDAAYNNAFYLFYNIKGHKSSNITNYTNLLSSNATKQYTILPEFELIVNHLKWLTPQSNITLLTDADVDDASTLFMPDGIIKYDAVVLGHNEYVSQLEYNNLRQYVANGGVLILLDGNVLYAEVKYDKKNQTIMLVKGHGWEFNGSSASKSINERWANETTEWVGSNYCECYGDDIRFGNNPFGVIHNEEQYITNPHAKIILGYQAHNASKTKVLPREFKIATYELDYQKGKVITLGLYTDDLLFQNDKFRKFFDSLLYYYVLREQN